MSSTTTTDLITKLKNLFYTKTQVDSTVSTINTNVSNVDDKVEARGAYFIFKPTVQKGSNLEIECYNADGTAMADGTVLRLIINGLVYSHTVSSGKITQPIGLSENTIYPIMVHKQYHPEINGSANLYVYL